MPVEALTVSVIDTGDDVLVVVAGTLDAATCPKFAGALESIGPDSTSDVVVDLSGVEFLDSTALDLFTRISLDLLTNGRRFILTNPSQAVLRLLSVTNLQTWLSTRE